MEIDKSRLSDLELLVDELLKPMPEEQKVQSYMRKVGLSDPGEPIGRLQTVLELLNFREKDKEFTE